MNKKLIYIIGLTFVYLPSLSYAQIETDSLKASTNTTQVSIETTIEEDFFGMAVTAYNDQQYTQAYELLKKAEAQSEWHPSLGYWKALTLDKIIKYNNVSEPKFIELSQEVDKLLSDAEAKEEDKRDLYNEHYRAIVLIEEKINFKVLKLKWNNDNNYQKALSDFKKQNYSVAKLSADEAAKSNNGAALLLIGKIYEIGNASQPQNFKTAMTYYQNAFLAGSFDAAYHIGYLYFHGLGVLKNIDVAFEWCQIAANYNYIPAMKELSNMYKHGLGTQKNKTLSEYWWEKATTQPE